MTGVGADHAGDLPFAIPVSPDDDEPARLGYMIVFGMVDEPVQGDFDRAETGQRVNLQAPRYKLACNLAADIFFDHFQEVFFRAFQAASVVVELDTVGIDAPLGIHIAVVVRVEINTVHAGNGPV